VVLERTVSWYEEVHIVEESKTELVTLQYTEHSTVDTTVSITVTASYSKEASSSYSSLSWDVVNIAQTTNVETIPSYTKTVTGILISTP
jgi:hypothetical protein